ncbi:MAG TPA: hypothetical protein VLE94_08005 [Burkholderiaceae bacterium]|nr:hypothetical protein [Burkholderiaceae bacterium]
MIRPLSGGAVAPTEFAATAHAADNTAAQRAEAPGAAAVRTGDPLAKLVELLGTAPMQRLYAGNGGHGGGTAVKKTDPLVGTELPGQKGVVIQRSFGDAKGYDTRNHALAWARAMGSDKAMVVQGKDRRWHAVETSQVGKSVAGGKGDVIGAIQVGRVDPAVYEDLRKKAMEKNDPEKWKDFASYALGVPRDEIHIVTGNDEPSRTKVNINLTRDFDAEGKTAGFDPAKPPWVQLGPAAFDRPANACATLAHEEVHADHHRMTKPLYEQYQHYMSGHPKSKESFREWAMNEANKVAKTEKSDPMKVFQAYRRAEVVAGMQDGTFGATELEAHVEAAKLAFASGDLVQARTDLNKVRTLPVMPSQQTKEVSIAVLKDLKAGLGDDALKVFNEVAKTAPTNNVLRDSALQPR